MEERVTLDKMIHKLKEIQTNSEGVRSWEDMAVVWTDLASWTDVISWISKEIEKNQELKNNLGDIITELEEYKKEQSIKELIKAEHKNRTMALALERKSEYYKSKADMYLEKLMELDNFEKEESDEY